MKFKLFNETFLKSIEKDLKDLFDADEISEAKKMNVKPNAVFAVKREPMYFTGKFDAKTVFVMLNPGNDTGENYSFKKKCKSNYSDYDHYFNDYMERHILWGEKDDGRMDNFDLKQAAFLFDFKQSGIDLPDFSSTSEINIKLKAKRNVLMEKLQLELVPYCSREFKGVLDTLKQAKENLEIFIPHIERLLDAIVSYERKYVVFGSRQFEYLLKAYKEKTQNTKIEFIVEDYFAKVDDLAKEVSFSIVKITHRNKTFHAIIANTFPRRDLPNAYRQMRDYGELCWEGILKHINN